MTQTCERFGRTIGPDEQAICSAPRVSAGEIVLPLFDDARHPGWFFGATLFGVER